MSRKKVIYLILTENRWPLRGSAGVPEASLPPPGQLKATLVCRHKRQQVLMALFSCSPRAPSSLCSSRSLTQIPPFWLRRSNVTLEAFNTDPTVIWSRIKMPRHLRRLGSEVVWRTSPDPDPCLICVLLIFLRMTVTA